MHLPLSSRAIRLANGEIWLLTIYAKGYRSTVPAHELKTIKEAIHHGREDKNES